MDVIEATLACSIPSSFLVPLPRSEGWVARRGRERNPAKPLFSTTSLFNEQNFLKSSLRSIFLFRSLPSAHFRQEDMCHSCPSLSKEFLSDLKQQGRYTPRRGRKRRETKRETNRETHISDGVSIDALQNVVQTPHFGERNG